MAAQGGGADGKGQGAAAAGTAGKDGQPHAGTDVEAGAGGGLHARAAAPDWLEVERKGSWRGRCATCCCPAPCHPVAGCAARHAPSGFVQILLAANDLKLCGCLRIQVSV